MVSLLFLLLLAPAEPPFEQHLRAGVTALSQGNLDEAQRQLEAASLAQPGNALAWVALAQTYGRLKQTTPALKAATEAERLAPSDPGVLHALAIFYSEQGNLVHAADCESRYAESPEADTGATARAAALSLRAGKTDRAIAQLRGALAKADTADLHHLLGQALELVLQRAEAREELGKAVERQPEDETYRFTLVQLLLRDNDFAAAIAALQGNPKQLASSPQLQLALGVAYYGERKFEPAIDAFLATTRLDPSIPQPYVFLGRLLDQAGFRIAEIQASFAANLKAHPEDFMSLYLQARLDLFLNANSTEGEKLLRQSVTRDDSFWESHAELGQLLLRRRDYTGAERELARAAELAPQQPSPHFHLARAYDRLGQTERAAAERARHQELTNAPAASR